MRQTECDKNCKTTLIQRKSVKQPDGTCKPELVATDKKCCCPAPELISTKKCNPQTGMLSNLKRSYKLDQGECVPSDELILTPTHCPKNFTTRVLKLKNGWLQFERTSIVRKGCSCKKRIARTYKMWSEFQQQHTYLMPKK